MTEQVRIYQPAKSALQSGRGKTKLWVLEFEPCDARRPDALMGWIGSSDTQSQVRLNFESREEALAFAAKKGYVASVDEPRPVTPKIKSYSDNFRPDRIRW